MKYIQLGIPKNIFILGYKINGNNMIVTTADKKLHISYYSKKLEKSVLEIMEIQAQELCQKEEFEDSFELTLNTILECFTAAGFITQSFYSEDSSTFNIGLLCMEISIYNGSYEIHTNNKIKQLKKIKYYLENKKGLNQNGISINNIDNYSINKLKKITKKI